MIKGVCVALWIIHLEIQYAFRKIYVEVGVYKVTGVIFLKIVQALQKTPALTQFCWKIYSIV